MSTMPCAERPCRFDGFDLRVSGILHTAFIIAVLVGVQRQNQARFDRIDQAMGVAPIGTIVERK